MTPITKAIVILDQASDALRTDEDEGPVGLDLIPDLTFLTGSSSALSLDITLAVPGLEGGGLDGLEEGFAAPHGLRIVALPPLEYGVPIGLRGAAGGDTALVAADRRLRGEAACRAGARAACGAVAHDEFGAPTRRGPADGNKKRAGNFGPAG